MPKIVETRVEFKKLLDEISSIGVEVRHLQKVLSEGPSRHLEINGTDIHLKIESSGYTFNWEPEDPRTAVTSLVVTGVYEELETAILRKIAAVSLLIVDVGANTGYYAIELASLISESSSLIAFEPISKSFQQLRKNIS